VTADGPSSAVSPVTDAAAETGRDLGGVPTGKPLDPSFLNRSMSGANRILPLVDAGRECRGRSGLDRTCGRVVLDGRLVKMRGRRPGFQKELRRRCSCGGSEGDFAASGSGSGSSTQSSSPSEAESSKTGTSDISGLVDGPTTHRESWTSGEGDLSAVSGRFSSRTVSIVSLGRRTFEEVVMFLSED
jgi:hypothetical protein